ncbi:MAG: glycosyltransferase family 4 protein [Bacteriovorax sp.]
MKRCLWVVPKGIFPVRDGARVANHALLKAIRPHFDELDIMVFNEEDNDELYLDTYNSEFNPSKVYFFKKASHTRKWEKMFFFIFNFLCSPKLPITAGYFYTAKLRKKVAHVLHSRRYDLIVFDALHPYAAFNKLERFKDIPVVYRAHNVEGDLWSTAASKEKNRLIQKLLLWQGRKMTDLEMNLIRRSKKVWSISEDDLIRFKSILNHEDEKLEFIPAGIDFKRAGKKNGFKDDDAIKLLFLGKMDWPPNKDGLRWFLEEVWPNMNHKKFILQIVGSGDSSWGADLFKLPGIEFLGFVKDLEGVYLNCDFSVIPIRYGSGTRIKVIESIAKGIPIVSTDAGIQGSGLIDFFHAETAREWIEVLSSLDRSTGQTMATAAFEKLKLRYSPKYIGEKAFNSLQV